MMRYLWVAVALLCLSMPVHGQQTKSAINTEINTLFFDNTVGGITPLSARTVASSIVNSIMPTAPVTSGNLTCFNGTTGLLKDCGSPPILSVLSPLVLSSSQLSLPSLSSGIVQFTAPGPGGATQTATNRLATSIVSSDYGMNGNGIADNCTAIGNINTQISTLSVSDVYLNPGTYIVNCNITLSGVWHFTNGSILKPGNGFTITFANMYVAGAYQIFNLYTASTGTLTGGNIAVQTKGVTDIWGEQFGMIGDDATLHNEVGMQLAHNTLFPNSSSNGGNIRLGTGVFLMCGHYTILNNVSVQGMGRAATELLANSGCWNSDTNMVISVNTGNIAQFGCWHRDIQLNAGAVSTISAVINAGSWQEDSGLERVLINNFMGVGVFDNGFYGGSATINIIDVELFSSATTTATTIGLDFQSPGTQNWTYMNLKSVVYSANKTSIGNEYAAQIYGRINVNAVGTHIEQSAVGFDLNDRAVLSGFGINGGPGSGILVQIDTLANPVNSGEANTGAGTLMSRVAVAGLELGGGTTLFKDLVNTITISDQFGLPFSYPSQSSYNGPKPTCGTGCASVTGTNQNFNAVTGSSVTSVTLLA